jgi:hypothetical protein
MRTLERGSSLVENMVASVVAIAGAMAMIFAIVSANAGIKSNRIERGAFFAAQQKLERLVVKPPSDPELTIGSHGPVTTALPWVSGQTSWTVSWMDDALDGTGGSDTDPQDYRKLQVTVTWNDVIARSVALTTYRYP